MSTVLAYQDDDSICLAADTLSKYGDAKESASLIEGFSKIVDLGSSSIAFVGPASFGLILESYLGTFSELPVLRSKKRYSSLAAGCTQS